ncbi:hypothetical protein FSP39_019977 [Pinctada imbricata]|uniref:MHD domain-containing protein n=1 Tax=Pinctada imbricata TaxID=66713 RepID=A0AA88XWJ0_PINIB|nr:hypothetical protein FSP39_019977 [Pinctada imbricata]
MYPMIPVIPSSGSYRLLDHQVFHLTLLYHICKDFCGTVSDDSISANSLLIMEILGEFLDFGLVQIADTDKLRPYIQSDPILVRSGREPTSDLTSRMFGIETKVSPSSASSKSVISSNKSDVPTNELFVDIIERLTASIGLNGAVSRMEVNGTINVKNFLKGNPQIRIGLNENLKIRKEGTIRAFGEHVELDSCSFHPCVNQQSLDDTGYMTVSPPIGEFSLMTYSVCDAMSVKIPFQLRTFVESIQGSRDVNLTLRLQSCFPHQMTAMGVKLKVTVPAVVDNISKHLDSDVGHEQSAEFKHSDREIIWQVKSFPGNTQVVAHFRLINNSNSVISKSDIGPYGLDFEISGYSSTGLLIRNVKVMSKDKSNPKKWIRFITVSDNYIIKG